MRWKVRQTCFISGRGRGRDSGSGSYYKMSKEIQDPQQELQIMPVAPPRKRHRHDVKGPCVLGHLRSAAQDRNGGDIWYTVPAHVDWPGAQQFDVLCHKCYKQFVNSDKEKASLCKRTREQDSQTSSTAIQAIEDVVPVPMVSERPTSERTSPEIGSNRDHEVSTVNQCDSDSSRHHISSSGGRACGSVTIPHDLPSNDSQFDAFFKEEGVTEQSQTALNRKVVNEMRPWPQSVPDYSTGFSPIVLALLRH